MYAIFFVHFIIIVGSILKRLQESCLTRLQLEFLYLFLLFIFYYFCYKFLGFSTTDSESSEGFTYKYISVHRIIYRCITVNGFRSLNDQTRRPNGIASYPLVKFTLVKCLKHIPMEHLGEIFYMNFSNCINIRINEFIPVISGEPIKLVPFG